MIFTDRTITVRKGESRIDEPIVVYRGDYELEVRFTILNSKFRFMSGTNLIESEKASYGQLAILTPYGGNIFSDIVRCNDGSVTFVLTAEMLNQIEEVGLYSFQIRLMDYTKESRVSIPPIEFGIEVREPIASEDHDNSVNNAIVGYSIAKVVDPKEENVGNIFDESGNYNKTKWETGDRISEGKLNKIEDAIDSINRNEKNDSASLSKRIDNNFNVLDATKADKNEIFTMANMGQDIKEAMTGGSVAVVGHNAILNENIVNNQISPQKIRNMHIGKNLFNKNAVTTGCYYNGNTGEITRGTSSTGLNCISEVLRCDPNTTYYRNKKSNAVYWDSNMNYVGRDPIVTTGAFTPVENAHYMGFSLEEHDLDSFQVEIGLNGTSYEPYYAIPMDYNVVGTDVVDVMWYKTSRLHFSRNADASIDMDIDPGNSGGLYIIMSNRQILRDFFEEGGHFNIPDSTGLIFNVFTKEYRVSPIGGSAKPSEWVNSKKGDILLLANLSGRPHAGVLLDDYNWVINRKTSNSIPVIWVDFSMSESTALINELDWAAIDFKLSGPSVKYITFEGYLKSFNFTESQFTLCSDEALVADMVNSTTMVMNINKLYPNMDVNGYIPIMINRNGRVRGGVCCEALMDLFNRDSWGLDTIGQIVDVYSRYEKISKLSITQSGTTINITSKLYPEVYNNWTVYWLTKSGSYSKVTASGENSGDTSVTYTLDHNDMLILNTKEQKIKVESMKSYPVDLIKGDILLALNIDGKIVAGELRDTLNDIINETTSLTNSMYDMGRLKFKFDVDAGGSYISSESLVGDELWVFPVSNDEGTNFMTASRYKMDFENNTATKVGSFTHNWGHVNSSAYNPWRDALICGNGSGSYDLMGQIFIFENASSFKDRTQVNRSEAVTINVQEWGYKANVIWGESNMGRGDICYVITNDAQNVRKLQLGMGANNLGSGVMFGDRSDSQFNGTYKVLGEWTLPRIDVVQGSNYENGALYIGLGHDTAWYTKNHLHDDGFVTYETYKEKFYNADGSQLKCNMQGITVTDKYIILGLQGGSLPTNQIHVYYR